MKKATVTYMRGYRIPDDVISEHDFTPQSDLTDTLQSLLGDLRTEVIPTEPEGTIQIVISIWEEKPDEQSTS